MPRIRRNAICSPDCALSVCEGGDWALAMSSRLMAFDTMLMYFRMDDTVNNIINAVLAGNHTECIQGFYPVGRLATIKDIHIVYDRSVRVICAQRQLANLSCRAKARHDKRTFGQDLGRGRLGAGRVEKGCAVLSPSSRGRPRSLFASALCGKRDVLSEQKTNTKIH